MKAEGRMTNGEWKTVALGEVAGVFNGKTPSKAEQRSEGHPVLKIKDVSELGEYRGKFESFVDHKLAVKFSEKRVCAGDTLILNAAHNADYVASKTYHAQPSTFGALATGEWLIVRPSEKSLDGGFVHHWVTSTHTRRQLRELVNGIHLYPKDVARLRIALPPLAEQRRIAEVLDRAEALQAKRRAALAQLDSLTQSLFLDLFGDPATNPKHWPKAKLEQLCSVDAPLVNPTREEYRNLLHYGPDRIERDTGGLLPAQTAEDDALISSKFLFEKTAVLYSKIRPNLNKVALAKERALCSADVYPVEVQSEKLTREFLWCLLRGNHFLSYAAEFSNRANIPKINRGQFLGYPAICPPIELQREFARRVTAVEKLKASQRVSLAELDALFASLQHRAFRGEL